MLVVGRAVAGMGGSGLINGSLTIIAVAAHPSKRPAILATVMAMAGAGQLLGPLVGGKF
jgi:MFS family permease